MHTTFPIDSRRATTPGPLARLAPTARRVGASLRRPGQAFRSMPTGAGAMTIAVLAQTASNVAFHGVVGRSLSTASYGALGTLLGLMIMLTVPLGSLQAALNRAAAQQPGSAPGTAVRKVALGSLVLALGVAAASLPIRSFLHLPSLSLTLLLAPYVFVAAVLAATRGVLLGQGHGTAVAVTMGIATVLRLVAGAVLTPRYGVDGAMIATVGSEAIGLLAVLALLGLGRSPATTAGAEPLRLTRADIGSSGLAVAGLWAFTSVDMLLARHALAASPAGGYVAASTLARCAMALPTALVMVAMPRLAAPSLADARTALRHTLTVVGTVAVLGALPLILAPALIQGALFGGQPAPLGLVRLLAVIAIGSSLCTTMTYFHLARSNRAALLPWLGAALEVGLIAANHGSAQAVAVSSALATVPMVAVLAWSVRPSRTLVAVPGTAPTTPSDPTPGGTRLWEPADPTIDLSVVIPFYNPGDSVGRTIARAVDLLRADGLGFEIIAVSDGSTDGSEVHVPTHLPEVQLIVAPQNEGKGATVQRGMAASAGRAVGFIDADGDIDPIHLVRYVHILRSGGHDLVFASKRHGASATESSAGRRIISITYSTLVSSLFRLGVSDTQTGAKVMRREVAASVLPWACERRFAFDLELFVVARRLGFRDLEPAPVHLGERMAGSTVTKAAVLRTLRDTLTIWKRLNITREYPSASVARSARSALPRTLEQATLRRVQPTGADTVEVLVAADDALATAA